MPGILFVRVPGVLYLRVRRAGRTHKEMGGISAFWREM